MKNSFLSHCTAHPRISSNVVLISAQEDSENSTGNTLHVTNNRWANRGIQMGKLVQTLTVSFAKVRVHELIWGSPYDYFDATTSSGSQDMLCFPLEKHTKSVNESLVHTEFLIET